MAAPFDSANRSLNTRAFVAAALASLLLIALLLPLHASIALVNLAMLMLLLVAVLAARFGRGPAILASVILVLGFDVGFVPPRGSLSVHDAEYLIVFAVMLAVALIVSQISGASRQSRLRAEANEREQRALYQLAARLNAGLRVEQVVEEVRSFLKTHFDAQARLIDSRMIAEADASVQTVDGSGERAWLRDGDPLRPHRLLLPLRGATRSRGVLEVRLPAQICALATHAQVLELVAGLLAASLERLHYLEVAIRTQTEVEAERLRNLLLAGLSHDLRTPLTVLHGWADALRENAADLPELATRAARVCEEALRLNRLCDNLLDLAKLRSAPNLLQREWVMLEELIGAALAGLAGVPGANRVRVTLTEDLPWLRLDPLMFERVLTNLIDNALKQGGEQQDIEVLGARTATGLRLTVRNSGSRFPATTTDLLQPFTRAPESAAIAGVGLGLSICRSIIEAHGGTIELGNSAFGAEVHLDLPMPAESMPKPPEAETEPRP